MPTFSTPLVPACGCRVHPDGNTGHRWVALLIRLPLYCLWQPSPCMFVDHYWLQLCYFCWDCPRRCRRCASLLLTEQNCKTCRELTSKAAQVIWYQGFDTSAVLCELLPRGRRVLSELVAHLFLTTLSDLSDHPLDSMDTTLAAAPLPHPMILNNWESKTDRWGSLCVSMLCLAAVPHAAVATEHAPRLCRNLKQDAIHM
jgi:hypothetical protein